jgi:peroxiredoxin Q/BCP
MPLKIGDDAPDFTLRAQDGTSVSLAQFRGKSNVVLIFYPKDQTPGCTKQLCAARDDDAEYKAYNAAVFGVNGDDGLTMPLLIDPGLAVAKTYDAVMGVGPLKIVNRTVVGIDRNGKVAFYERGIPSTKAILSVFATDLV